jgi:hypothetical protein
MLTASFAVLSLPVTAEHQGGTKMNSPFYMNLKAVAPPLRFHAQDWFFACKFHQSLTPPFTLFRGIFTLAW